MPALGRSSVSFLVELGVLHRRAELPDAEAYFYGFPPFTWLVPPVLSTVSAEYLPDPAAFEKDQAELAAHAHEGWSSRWYKPWS